MIFKQIQILNYNTQLKQWTTRIFESYPEWFNFVSSCERFPGEYGFTKEMVEAWTTPARTWNQYKRYTLLHPKSKEFKEFWLLERRKCLQGFIVDDRWISPDYYWFLNYTPIFNKIEKRVMFADVWDGHYHYDMYMQLAYFEDQDAAMTKARQKGISLYHVSRLARKLWFFKKANLKILATEDPYREGEWGILTDYRNFLNENTAWYRNFSPDEHFNWVQRLEVTKGDVQKKKTFKGNNSKISAILTKRSVARAVGGSASEIYCTEAGIFKGLKKVKGYVDPNLKMGGVKTGMFVAAGAVGELDDAQDLMEFCFNPKAYNIRSVRDVFSGSEEEIAFFFPDEWNYIYKDEKTGTVIKCYDEWGNSDLKLANEILAKEEEEQKKKDEVSYKLWKSQHPKTLQDAFDQREDNPFPTQELRFQEMKLLDKKDIIVKIEKDMSGVLTHKFSTDVPVQRIKPRPNEDNRGAIIIKEFPVAKPPFGLYYAGVDPVYNIDTSSSVSLMSITIWIGWHEKEGKICEPYPVATYTGRHKKATDTYEICMSLIEYYNARTAVESNVKDFIEWGIKQGKSKYFMRRREVTVISEMMPNSTIRDEIGVRMEGEFKKRCVEKMVTWLTTPAATSFDMVTGESREVYNVERIWDKMFIREMLKYNPNLNTDRLISNMLALIACQSDSNRHIISSVKHTPNKPIKKISLDSVSPFRTRGGNLRKTLPSPFKRN